MNNYRLKISEVQAVHYTGQPLEQLPAFVRNYAAFSAMSGESKLGVDLTGNILIPHHGGYYTCKPGNWLVQTGKLLVVVTDKVFNEQYEAVPAKAVETSIDPALMELAVGLQPAPVEQFTPVPETPVTIAPVTPTASTPAVEQAPTAADVAPVVTETTSDASQQQ